MIYPIYIHGSAVLRAGTENIDKNYPDLGKLISDMFDTMYASEGVGLAAPQIGKAVNIFVIDASPFSDDDPGLQNFKKVFINAEIYERFGDDGLFNEGCLSFPGIREDVSRKTQIRIKYLDENFVEHDEEYSGTAARIIQHEYDHIEGKSFIDHLSPLRKTLLKSKLAAMAKGKYKADYKTRQDK
ncbi:MAG: peptide deformylase [Rikenellaceae bacterium]|nr:peptide deformylase [Rikenellaceae bacterium]